MAISSAWPASISARRTAFVQNRDAIAVSIGKSFIGKGFDVIQPDPLAADFMADGARRVHERSKKIQRLFAHRNESKVQ